MAVSRSWVYVSFASFAVVCELCAKGIRSRKRDTLAQSSQWTAKLAKKLISPGIGVVSKEGRPYRFVNQ